MDKKSTTARGRHGQFSAPIRIGGCKARGPRVVGRPAVPPSVASEQPQTAEEEEAAVVLLSTKTRAQTRFDFATHAHQSESSFRATKTIRRGVEQGLRCRCAPGSPPVRLRLASGSPPVRLRCASRLLLASLAPKPSASVAVAGHAAASHTSAPSRMRWSAAPPPSDVHHRALTTVTTAGVSYGIKPRIEHGHKRIKPE